MEQTFAGASHYFFRKRRGNNYRKGKACCHKGRAQSVDRQRPEPPFLKALDTVDFTKVEAFEQARPSNPKTGQGNFQRFDLLVKWQSFPIKGGFIRMANENILAEREFDILLKYQVHKVKVVAVFIVLGYAPQESGVYHLHFTIKDQPAEICQPDKNRYSRAQAKRAAELAFTSGQIEAYAANQIQSWIYLGR
jgi:hypothetical protein